MKKAGREFSQDIDTNATGAEFKHGDVVYIVSNPSKCGAVVGVDKLKMHTKNLVSAKDAQMFT